jgi:hypothetical protein
VAAIPLEWPPTLAMLKQDQRIPDTDVRDDDDHTTQLAAAISFVEGRHDGMFDFADDSGSTLPRPPAEMVLGAIRLAIRWKTRRRSPDALITAGELGSSRVPSFDPDIERMLQIGRYSPPVTA